MQTKSFEYPRVYIIESSVLIHGVPHMLSSFALNFQIAVYGYPRFSARITPLAILPRLIFPFWEETVFWEPDDANVQELGDCRHRRWLMTGPLELVVG
jgi:hypothetical protein